KLRPNDVRFLLLHSAFVLLHSYFCILTSAFLLLHSYFCILTSYSLFENAGKEALHLSEKAARLLLRWRGREHGGGHRGGCARRREGHGITIQARRWRRLQVSGRVDDWRVQ